ARLQVFQFVGCRDDCPQSGNAAWLTLAPGMVRVSLKIKLDESRLLYPIGFITRSLPYDYALLFDDKVVMNCLHSKTGASEK
ncbi:MAG: hypothetical protein KJZ93_30135, partial [Caldilineaceae bacterium]|nr:hypothetical protein [Caldilineaceae bacterium]